MAVKLKSISKQIHWSSLLKAAVFALAWFILPFWLFLLVALYLYFVPVTGSGKVAGPFFILLLVAIFEPASWLFALIFGGVFFYILLIKDLLLIDRKSAYEVLILFLSFFILRDFYLKLGSAATSASLFVAFLAAAAIAILFSDFVSCFSDILTAEAGRFRRTASWLAFLLAAQAIIVCLFLPLDFIYQTILAFLMVVLLVDLVPSYIFGDLTRQKAFATIGTVFALTVIILASGRWGL